MNKKIWSVVLLSVLALSSCKQSPQPAQETDSASTASEQSSQPVAAPPPDAQVPVANTQTVSKFDINSLPETTADLGDFPYFKLPEWVDANSSYGGDKNTDTGKLEVYTGDNFYPVEGKVFVKSYNMQDPNSKARADWDEYKFTKSFSKFFESLGARKIWEGKVPDEAKKALNALNGSDDYYYKFGHSQQENQILYGLKYKGKPAFFSIATTSAYGSIAVAESDDFVQTITMLKSDQIQKDLIEKGKAVLHINFDIDKATLKPDGNEAVAEISKVLKADTALKLDVNGYTDNTGADAHNLQLSKDRAAAVVSELVKSGIDAARLSSNGFGSQNPIADNSTEDGKAQNRRVELVKK